MKTKLFTLLLAVAASVGTLFAQKVQIGDLYYNLDATNQTAEVTSQNSSYPYWSTTITTANIPASVTYASVTYSVTSIGNYAFWGCSGLTSMTIPNSVTSIGSSAFRDCTSLTSVTIPNSVTSIGEGAFYGCSGLPINDNCRYADTYLVEAVDKTLSTYTIKDGTRFIGSYAFSSCSGLTSVTIPNSVTSIGGSAFFCCSGLISITIPNSVTSIGGSAFFGCSGLTSITIPNSVTSIGGWAFYKCTGLTSPVYNAHVFAFMPTSYSGAYTIPDGIESIAGYAFFNCTGLTSVTIPNSVTSIGEDAFDCCSGLTSVTIPNSVTSIGFCAFRGCSGLTSIDVASGNSNYCSVDGVVFNKGKTTLIQYPEGKQGAYTIPNSVTSIGDNAFYYCSGLTSVTIGNSVTSIGERAFYECSGLTSVKIGNSVKSIGKFAFNGCRGLTSVTIPNSVTSIGMFAFMNCGSLTSVTIGSGVKNIDSYAFQGCSGLTSVTIKAMTPPALNQSNYGIFYGASNCPINVPCGTLEAYKTAWADYASRIQYGPAIDFITTYAENGHVDISAYDNTNATICDGELFVFTLTPIPNNGYHFTQWSDGLKDNPRTIELTQDTTFTAEFAPDRVGTCGKDLALVWSYDPMNKVLTIGNAGSFTENMQFGLEAPNEMEELVIGNSVTAIGANAFAGIETLKKVSIGESVKTIGEQAFYNCVNLETIFNYRPTPTNTYSNAFDGVDKFECKLYVLPSSIDMYKAAAVWRDFYYTYAIGAEETTVTTNDVTVEPQDNAVTVTWPTSNNAATYTIQITKDGVLFCTLIFNGNGQLTGIAFAPSRDGQAHAPQALMTAKGMQFTVTGLDSGTHYALTLQAKDSQETVLASYSSEFTTTGESQGFEDIQGNNVQCTKFLRDGQIFILRGEKVYTLQGQEVK